jgi:hypothetical protein
MTEGVALSVSQFLDAWGPLRPRLPGIARVETAAGVKYIFTGLPIPFFNVAVPTLGPLSATRRSKRPRAAPCSGPPTRTHRGCSSSRTTISSPAWTASPYSNPCGLMGLLPLTGMVAKTIAPVAASRAVCGSKCPRTTAAAATAIDVNSAAYGMDLNACKAPLGRGAFWADHLLVLGRADGVP